MSVLVQTPDGWETVPEGSQVSAEEGALTVHGDIGLVCVYAPGQWLYAEITE